jgi:hypothetical protein
MNQAPYDDTIVRRGWIKDIKHSWAFILNNFAKSNQTRPYASQNQTHPLSKAAKPSASNLILHSSKGSQQHQTTPKS